MVLNGNLQLGGSAPSAEEKMAEKKIMRAISKRRQKERNSLTVLERWSIYF